MSIGALGRLVGALDRAGRAGVIDAAAHLPDRVRHPEQAGPDRGRELRRQAEYLAISERIAYANPRVAAFSQYLMGDDQPRGGSRLQRYSGFETGLKTSRGKRKPAYDGFILPLAVKQYGSNDVLWGRVRPATGPTEVTIQHKLGRAAGSASRSCPRAASTASAPSTRRTSSTGRGGPARRRHDHGPADQGVLMTER